MAQDFTYCRTRWRHGLKAWANDIWSELDGYRFENRRLEFFEDGRVTWTCPEEWAGAEPTTTPLPELAEMADDSDCVSAEVVTAEEFEAAWARRPERP